MHALTDLFTSDAGCRAIAFTLGMAGFFIRYTLKHVREDEAAAHVKR